MTRLSTRTMALALMAGLALPATLTLAQPTAAEQEARAKALEAEKAKMTEAQKAAAEAAAKQVPTGVTEQPRALKMAEEKFDWGTIQDTKPVEHKIEFTNTTSEEITLAVAASCGCTAVGMDKNTYKPGEAGSVTAKFDPHGRMGSQTKTITFTVTNPQGKYAQQMVTLTANVEALTWWDPGKVYLTEVDHKEGKTQTLRLLGRKEGFNVTKATANSEFVRTKIGEARKIEFSGANVTEVPIELEVGKGAPIGNLSVQLNVETNDDRVTMQPYFIGADVVGDLKAMPANAIIRVNDPGTPFTTTLTLSSRSGSAFNITSLDVESAKMNVVPDARKDDATNSYVITLSGVTPNEGGVFQGNLVVSSDARGGEMMKIPFTAVIRKPVQAAPAPAAAPGMMQPAGGSGH